MKSIILTACLVLSGCAAQLSSSSPELDSNQVVYIMPLTNQSTMPMAQAQVEQLLVSTLAEQGLKVEIYPKVKATDLQASIEPEARQNEAKTWLAAKPSGYVMSGSVQEWQYKYGLDGEPVVGVTLQLTDLQGRLLWQGSVAKTGWGRESITQLGLDALQELTDDLNWD